MPSERQAPSRPVWRALKLVVTVLLLTWAIRQIELRATLGAVLGLGWRAALAATLLTGASLLVGAWRWQRILRLLGEHLPLGRLTQELAVATLYNFVLPTSVGGDVVRGWRVAPRLKQAEHAWASVLYERLLGLIALALLATAGLGVVLDQPTRPLLLFAGGLCLGLIALLWGAAAPLRLGARWARRWSEALARSLEGLAGSFQGPLASARARGEVLGWSLLYQLTALTILAPAAWAWSSPELLGAIYFALPVALIATVLPITVGGFGLRESLFVALSAPLGVPSELAMALAILWVASSALIAALGALALLAERR